jgi:hypothetical protein
MSKFDKTVNLLLNRLVFEQDENNLDQENQKQEESDFLQTPEETESNQTPEENQLPESEEEKKLTNIEKKYENEGNAYLIDSERKYNSGEEYVDNFLGKTKQILTSFSDSEKGQVSESALMDDLKKFKDYAVSGGKKFLSAISSSQEKLADLTVNNMDKIANYAVGKEFAVQINNELSESFLYKAVAIFLDPTGIMSWPYLKKATDAYDAHKGTEDEAIYQLNLLAAQISVIPNFAFKPIFGILTLPFRIAFGGGAKIAEKIFGVAGTRKVARGLSNWMKKILPFKPRSAKLADRAAKSSKLGSKSTKLSKFTPKLPKIGQLVPKLGKYVPKVVKGVPVMASGNIPKFLEDLQSRGEKVAKTSGSKVGTLGRFPRFGEISTQRP